ncbi:uncharacterized protein N0V96_000777 [Colletotrichum fioriniae]|uniref:uncharacterized protein n=1 Tax=Colletotrichum fioriniae TaxID=710243 RepID=UPI0032D9BA23|nr:hypothetical protein N0V96_000777 [Colletotrichum fioriniae]
MDIRICKTLSCHLSPAIDATQLPGPLEGSKIEHGLTEGYKCEVQTLYEGPPKCQCCKNWVEEYPDDLRTSVEQQPEVKLKALIVRMRKNHEDGKPLVLDSIVVQNQSLKETLGEVFEGYAGITASLKKLVFKSPFRPFYYRWQQFTEIIQRQMQNDQAAATFSQLLYKVLYAELRETMAEIKDHLSHGVITYPLLWALFEPGKLVVVNRDGDALFYLAQSCGYTEEKGLVVSVRFIDWDLDQFGYADGALNICEFAGTRKITEIRVFPAEFLESRSKAEAIAIERGVKFQNLRGFHYMAYTGFVEYQSGRHRGKRSVDERIVVDSASYFRANPSERAPLAPLKNDSVVPKINVDEETHLRSEGSRAWCGTGRMQEDRYQHLVRKRKLESGELPLPTEEATEPGRRSMPWNWIKGLYVRDDTDDVIPVRDLTEQELLLCNAHVRGYCLKLKIWAEFKVENVREIIWNDSAFPNLILPKGFKNLILSFVEGQFSKKAAFDDIIEGKGLGIVMLLVGNPGTGKTLTAEAVADKVRKPLYILSAGELGQDASGVEKRLTEVLDLTEKWDAVLLFDECDVFIQERSTRDLGHNEIVAVFLRLLEYYRGILFMTSNRAETIDRAFHSRIHLTLHYPDLEPAAKDQIWRQFSQRSKLENRLTDKNIRDLAQLPMNGRQIKNVLKIATLLAGQEDTALSIGHIRTVLQATKEIGDGHEI